MTLPVRGRPLVELGRGSTARTDHVEGGSLEGRRHRIARGGLRADHVQGATHAPAPGAVAERIHDARRQAALLCKLTADVPEAQSESIFHHWSQLHPLTEKSLHQTRGDSARQMRSMVRSLSCRHVWTALSVARWRCRRSSRPTPRKRRLRLDRRALPELCRFRMQSVGESGQAFEFGCLG